MALIRLENLTKRFGAGVAVDGVELEIRGGEIFFLLGPSGCGKTTILRMIAGLAAPTAGRIYFDGRDVTGTGTAERGAVMCFQGYALWPHLTVRENVRFGLDVRGVGRKEKNLRVEEALGLVRLGELGGRRPGELSGGQQQRVALARALVVRPEVLLLDEPLSNLDAVLRLEMRGEIRRICKEAKLTAVYVTHDQKEALSIADRLAILDRGRVKQVGEAAVVYRRPASKFVAQFMGETNWLEGDVAELEGERIWARTRLGMIGGAGFAGARVGMKVVLSIRPEAVRIGKGGLGMVRLVGMMHDTVYMGEVAGHLISVAESGGVARLELKAVELSPRVVARDGAIKDVDLWIDPEDVVALRE